MAAGISAQAQTVLLQKYSKVVDLAGATASDVFEGPTVPANSIILSGGLVVTEAHAGTSTDMTLDVGVTGGVVDNFVDGFDMDAASVTNVGYNVSQTDVVVTTEDTVDVLVATQTGTTTAGKVEVFVMAYDADAIRRPGIAQVGS